MPREASMLPFFFTRMRGVICAWQRSHEIIDGRLYCTVSIWDEKKGIWVSKQDVGTESNTEKEKGQASDSFKRACFNWGM